MIDNNLSFVDSGISSSGGTTAYQLPTTSTLVKTIENGDSIEMIYKETLNMWPSVDQVYKIVFSCVDGKWNKSDRIYGSIVPACAEYYVFD